VCLAIPGRIICVSEGDPILRTGKVDFGGIVKDVALACVPDAQVGQYVLVHVGLAITVVDEAEARQVFDFLDRMGELGELEVESP
jgi:hydrogenase expression/formation protein HypC